MIMIASTMPAVRMPRPSGGPLEQRADQRQLAQRVAEPGLDVVGHERHEHEQAPHAVDDRGNRRPAARWRWRPAGAASAGAISVRNRAMPKLTGTAMHDGDERGDQGAEDRRQRAVVVVDRIPVGRGQEVPAVLEQHLAAAPQGGQRGAQQRQQHQQGADTSAPGGRCGRGGRRARARWSIARLGGGRLVAFIVGWHSAVRETKTRHAGGSRRVALHASVSAVNDTDLEVLHRELRVPVGLDLLDQAVRQRHVVQRLGLLLAVLVGPVEEVQHDLGVARRSSASCT